MKIRADIDNVSIVEGGQLNSGEYNARKLEVELTEEYNSCHKVMAVFILSPKRTYEAEVIDGECDIPMFNYEGDIQIGVYGFKVSNSDITVRYSPRPVEVTVYRGSFISKTENPNTYISPISKGIEFRSIDNKRDRLSVTVYGDIPDFGTGLSGNSYIESVFTVNMHNIPSRFLRQSSNVVSVEGLTQVDKIGNLAFQSCGSLQSIEIDGSFETLPQSLFSQCSSLKKIKLPDSVKYINNECFSNCYTLENINFPPNLIEISDNAFLSCEKLSFDRLPDTLQIIGSNAFRNCLNIKEVDLPPQMTSLGAYAFQNCRTLEKISIPSAITSIPSYCFSGCSALENVSLCYGVEAIGINSFYLCSALRSITIPQSVTSIGNQAFYSSGLASIVIPQSVTSIGNQAFAYCSALESATIMGRINSNFTYLFSSANSLKTVEMPMVSSVKSYSFERCTSLENVTIGSVGNPVTDIHTYAFRYVTQNNLTINVYVSNPNAGLANAPWGAVGATINYLQA